MARTQLIEIVRQGETFTILVDGVEVPGSIARHSVSLPVDPDDYPSVTLTLFARRLTVDNNYAAPTLKEGATDGSAE
jgi:hypothetical protein